MARLHMSMNDLIHGIHTMPVIGACVQLLTPVNSTTVLCWFTHPQVVQIRGVTWFWGHAKNNGQ